MRDDPNSDDYAASIATDLVTRCVELEWMPHAGLNVWLDGAWYNVQVRLLEPNLLPPEVFEVDERTG